MIARLRRAWREVGFWWLVWLDRDPYAKFKNDNDRGRW